MLVKIDKNLHTGFTWFGCGSFVPRAKVQRFLDQLGSISLPKERLRLSDMYFSIWTNQYPYQLSNPLTPLDQQEGWSNGVDQWAIVYGNIVNILFLSNININSFIHSFIHSLIHSL